jgi:four helix bundle protein
MAYSRFEELPIWQLAARIFEQAEGLIERAPRMSPALRHELETSALRISTNIAQSFERGSGGEVLHFLSEARGAAGQVRSIMRLLQRREWPPELKTEIEDIHIAAESCARQLRAWADVVRNTAEEAIPTPTPSPERFQKLLESLPPRHPLRQQEVQP